MAALRQWEISLPCKVCIVSINHQERKEALDHLRCALDMQIERNRPTWRHYTESYMPRVMSDVLKTYLDPEVISVSSDGPSPQKDWDTKENVLVFCDGHTHMTSYGVLHAYIDVPLRPVKASYLWTLPSCLIPVTEAWHRCDCLLVSADALIHSHFVEAIKEYLQHMGFGNMDEIIASFVQRHRSETSFLVMDWRGNTPQLFEYTCS